MESGNPGITADGGAAAVSKGAAAQSHATRVRAGKKAAATRKARASHTKRKSR